MCVSWLHEMLTAKEFELLYEVTANQAADIFTKHLTPRVFETHCRALGLKDEAADS